MPEQDTEWKRRWEFWQAQTGPYQQWARETTERSAKKSPEVIEEQVIQELSSRPQRSYGPSIPFR